MTDNIDPPWMAIARAEIGVHEIAGDKDNPRILEYHEHTKLQATDDETSWCSAFANWAMDKAGIDGSNMANARSWLTWGQPCEPRRGCIVVLWRGDPKGWQGHVGFYEGADQNHVTLLGGNQGDAVSYARFPTSRVLGYRWPSSEIKETT